MAENKKSVLLYCDIIHTVEKLDDVNAGLLFKHYLNYINDKKPIAPNLLIEIAFEPMKQNLKRDLKKWNGCRDKRSDAGKKSAGKKVFKKWLKENPEVYNISKDDHLFEAGRCLKYQIESYDNGYTVDWFYWEYCIIFHQQMATKSTSVESVKSDSTNPTVKVKVTVKDRVKVKDKVISNINNRLADFKKSLRTYLGDYDKELLNNFYLYWTEKKPKGKKMRFEMQKTFDISRRLKRWHNNNFNKKEKSSAKKEIMLTEKMEKQYGIN